jgi:hypothetical protein
VQLEIDSQPGLDDEEQHKPFREVPVGGGRKLTTFVHVAEEPA